MKKAVLNGGLLNGTVHIPSSKSCGHRGVICAALSKGKSIISGISLSDDISATIDGVRNLGAVIEERNGEFTIDGSNIFNVGEANINCRESGSTARFLIPVASVGGAKCLFTGEGRLPERPLSPLTSLLREHNIDCGDKLPLTISGKLTGGKFYLPGNISSQYITGLLFALPLCENDSDIILTTPLQSAGYVNLTLKILKDFGIDIDETPTGWKIKGNQQYIPTNFTVEGDWSQAAFFMAAGAIGGDIKLKGLSPDSVQGDMEAFKIFKDFGADIYWENDCLCCKKSALYGISIDASGIPDLVPILAVTAAFAEGETVIYNAERLRLKESDRLSAVAEGLRNIGADVEERSDSLIIRGGTPLHGGVIDGCNDHRIVMAFSIASTAINDKITITNAESINKSYPDFFDDFNLLGGNADVINMG